MNLSGSLYHLENNLFLFFLIFLFQESKFLNDLLNGYRNKRTAEHIITGM